MSRQPNFIILNHSDLSLEKINKKLKDKYCKDMNDIAFIDYSITNKQYIEKVKELDLIIENFNYDFSYYLYDFKRNLKDINQNITFLITSLFDSVCKEMSSAKNNRCDYMLPYIKD